MSSSSRMSVPRTQTNLGVLLREPVRRGNELLHERLAARGHPAVRAPHGNVLQFLDADGTSVSELARRAQITKQSMSALVDYLEERGYMERVPDPRDRRASIVRRTERGWMVEQVARASITQVESEWSRHLGEHDLHQLRSLLTRLVTMLEEE